MVAVSWLFWVQSSTTCGWDSRTFLFVVDEYQIGLNARLLRLAVSSRALDLDVDVEYLPLQKNIADPGNNLLALDLEWVAGRARQPRPSAAPVIANPKRALRHQLMNRTLAPCSKSQRFQKVQIGLKLSDFLTTCNQIKETLEG